MEITGSTSLPQKYRLEEEPIQLIRCQDNQEVVQLMQPEKIRMELRMQLLLTTADQTPIALEDK